MVVFVLASCGFRSESVAVHKIAISLGQCGGMPCAAEQVATSGSSRYSYTLYPHRRMFVATGPAFSEVVQRLRATPFFNERYRDSRVHNNSSSVIAISAAAQSGNEQVRVDESNSHYAQYRSFADFVLRPVRANVAWMRAHEEQKFRNANDLLDVAVIHGPLGKCSFYDARFAQPNRMVLRYAFRPQVETQPQQYVYRGVLPFEIIRRLVKNDKLASLYEDYPTMGDDLEGAKVNLTFRSGAYAINGPERQFWPKNLNSFISSVDRTVAQRLPLCQDPRP